MLEVSYLECTWKKKKKNEKKKKEIDDHFITKRIT